ncbi:MAG: ABC transporter permease subunit [Pseudonocardia sp.]
MTATTVTTPSATPARTAAPLGRLLRSELRLVLRRPRTLVIFGLFALLPVVMAIGIAIAGARSGGPNGGLIASVVGNGLVLPVAALGLALTLLLLPLGVSMTAADALAGEAAHGTMRGLLLAPVSRLRLVGVKAVGVLAVALLAVAVISLVGALAGTIIVGNSAGDGGLLTLSGTAVGAGEAIGRVALAAGWTVVQLGAVGAVALAVSSLTDHPLVVLAVLLGGAIMFGVLSAIPALDWLQPYLLITGWPAIADVLRDPVPLDALADTSLKAVCYVAIGLGIALTRMGTRDA